jgi:hypothetical protein
MALSLRQKIILAFSRTITGTLSLLASSCIIYNIFLRYKVERRTGSRNTAVTTYHRLLLGMSILDVLHSVWAALSTLPVPANSGAVYGHGTTATCSAQGFFVQLSAATPVYMASLSIYFMLKIRYNVSDVVLREKYEFWLHVVPLVFAFGSASLGVALKIFNPISLPELGCWIAPFPVGCNIVGGCTRGYKLGEHIDLYAWLFAYSWLFAAFAVVLVNNLLIYTSIRHQEKRNSTYLAARIQSRFEGEISASATNNASQTFAPPPPGIDNGEHQDGDLRNPMRNSHTPTLKRLRSMRSVKTSRTALVQSILYVSTAFFTAVWIFLPWLGSKLGVAIQWRFFFAFMVNIVNPLQGVFNLITFVRVQYLRLRATEKEWSRLRCIKTCLFSPCSTESGVFSSRSNIP